MLYGVTGVPGASKTLNTIKMLREGDISYAVDQKGNRIKDDSGKYVKRPVYYHNIKEVIFDDWIELDDDAAKEWFKLPAGALVVFDEAQGLFPACKPNPKDDIPLYISELNTSRHKGIDLFFITQHPSLLDVRLRRLIAPHYHYDRAFGSKLVTQFIFKKCATDPDDYFAKKDASRSSKPIDKKYYGTYKSTELDTHKFRPPKKLIVILVFILLVIVGITTYALTLKDRYLANTNTTPQSETKKEEKGFLNATSSPSNSEYQSLYPTDPLEYAKLLKPRITGLAQTAPIYDQLTQPVSYPKTLCVRHQRRGERICECFTQQASKLIVEQDVCNSLIDNRFFDHAIPDNLPIAEKVDFYDPNAPKEVLANEEF